MPSLCHPPYPHGLRFPSLASAPTCLVYPFNTSLSNRLLHFAVYCSCNIMPRPPLSRSPPTRLSFRRADARRVDRSSWLDRRDMLAREQVRSIGLSRSRWSFLLAFASCGEASRTSATRSLNRRSYYAIVEELIREIAWSYAPHEWTSKVEMPEEETRAPVMNFTFRRSYLANQGERSSIWHHSRGTIFPREINYSEQIELQKFIISNFQLFSPIQIILSSPAISFHFLWPFSKWG